MNGLNEIKGINAARTHQAVTELQAKAAAAKAQNHPNAEVFQAQADKLVAELH